MIIYRANNPGEIFIEAKDDGHPLKLVRRQLCFIGGNWIGNGAVGDRGPRDTACRELNEELSFDRPMQDTLELALLGVADREFMAPPTRKGDEFVPESDRKALATLKEEICKNATPYNMAFNSVSKEAILAADPAYQRDAVSGLCCYFTVALADYWWYMLTHLQQTYGNLSNESITLMTSLGEIIATGQKTAFGHDHALRRFFLSQGLPRAEELPMVDGATSEVIGPVPESYEKLLQEWNILKKPVTMPVAS